MYEKTDGICMNTSDLDDDSLFFKIFCLSSILMPTQIIFAHVSWAISDLLFPCLILVCMFKLKSTKISKAIVIIISIFFIQLLFSCTYVFRNPSDTIYLDSSFISVIKIFVCLLYAFFYYVFFYNISKLQYIKYLRLMRNIGAIFSVLCFVGPILHFRGIDTFLVTFGYRASATFDDPNLAAVYLILSIGYTISYSSIIENPKEKKKSIFYIGIMIIAVMMTVSKAAVFSLLFSTLILLMISIIYRHFKLFKRIAIGLITISFITLIIMTTTNLLDGILERFLTAENADELTTGRTMLWAGAIKIIFSDLNFIYGIGIGMFENCTERYGLTFHNRAHNTYLSFFSECGFLMLIILLFIIGWLYTNLRRIITEKNLNSAFGLLFSLICLIVELFALNLQNSRTTYVFFTFVYFYIIKFSKYEKVPK